MNKITTLALALALTASTATIAAPAYPDKPVSIVVPYSAGGPVDNFMRALGQDLSAKWKQPVLIVNKPGANEIIGADTVAKSDPDGYTLFAGTEAALTMNPHLYKSLSYNVEKDFVPISRLVALPLVLFVPKSSPANNLKELIQLAKSSGQPLTYGSSGTGGIAHLPMAMFVKQENIDMLHVPYKGAAPLIPDVIANRIDAAVLGVSVIEQHIKAGTLKALALSADERSTILPDVPTFKEQGVQDINAVFNIGLLAPAGTPDALVQKIASDAREVMLQPNFRAKNIDAYSYVAVASSPEEFKQFLADDLKIQGERVKTSGASLD